MKWKVILFSNLKKKNHKLEENVNMLKYSNIVKITLGWRNEKSQWETKYGELTVNKIRIKIIIQSQVKIMLLCNIYNDISDVKLKSNRKK